MAICGIGDSFNVRRPSFGPSRAQTLVYPVAMSRNLPHLLYLIYNCGQGSETCMHSGFQLRWVKEGKDMERNSDSIQ